ncbi:MAG: N-acetylmuramoyl-L-alanine amidase [Actinomycetota bacterium]
MRIYRLGDEGPEVGDIQERLTGLDLPIADDELGVRFGPSTDQAVRAFQAGRSLRVDGLVGGDTWGQLVEAGYRLGDRTLYLHSPYFRGDDVRALQRKLNALGFDAGREDGMFGPTTDRALREFQRNVGDEPDGIVGLHTISTLDRMRPLESAPSRALVREEEELLAPRASIVGRVLAIDPGDAGEEWSACTYTVAEEVASELASMGAQPSILRDPDEPLAALERARIANAMAAAMCVTIELAAGRPEASGPTCSYFGSHQTHSPAGMLLAQLILDELEVALDTSGHLQRLTVSMLRETRMPAVQVEPAFATNEREAAMTADPAFATTVGRAIAAGVRRYFRD